MAIPTLATIPTGFKAGKLYSVLPESGAGDFDVVRATTATRVNENGLIETVANNVPRLDYTDGGCPVLLTEPQSTNLVPYSEDFSQWTTEYATITSNSITSPDGSTNADKLVATASVQRQGIKFSLTPSGDVVQSVFAKKGEYSVIQISDGRAPNLYANFDLENGVLGSYVDCTPSIEPFANGWYRCVVTYNSTLDINVSRISIAESTTQARLVDFAGNGSDGVYIFGAQVEQGSYPTSYIPTSGSSVTRNADQVYGAGDAATFNDSEGVLMVEIAALSSEDLSERHINLSNNGTSYLRIQYGGTTNQIYCFVYINGIGVADIRELLGTTNLNKVALRYSSSGYTVYINGLFIETDIFSGDFTSYPLVDLSFNSSSSNNFYGKTKQVQYFNTALTDIEIETLTSWTSFIAMANGQNYTIY